MTTEKKIAQQSKLDKSRWEGCNFCKYELNDYPFVCVCGENGCSDSEYIPDYCPVCGCPLTTKAWEGVHRDRDQSGVLPDGGGTDITRLRRQMEGI